MKLNGWQRLWVLCSFVWALVVIAIVLDSWPRERNIHGNYERRIEHIPKAVLEGDPDNLKPRVLSKQEQLILKVEIQEQYYKELDRLPAEQAEKALIGFFAWFVSTGLAYLFGWMIAWVIRGFRHGQSRADKV